MVRSSGHRKGKGLAGCHETTLQKSPSKDRQPGKDLHLLREISFRPALDFGRDVNCRTEFLSSVSHPLPAQKITEKGKGGKRLCERLDVGSCEL